MSENRTTANIFKEAVEDASDALTFYKGLNAVKRNDRSKIKPQDGGHVLGSVNIDKDIQPLYPQEPRWDYAVGYCSDGVGKVYFIEARPANTREVSCVIKKAEALKQWAQNRAPALWKLPRGVPGRLHWIASGKVNIPRNTPQYRLLSTHPAILFPQKSLELK